jgi:N-formylmaleamate deformylase
LVDAKLHTSVDAFEVLAPPNPDWRELIEQFKIPMLLLIAVRVSPKQALLGSLRL